MGFSMDNFLRINDVPMDKPKPPAKPANMPVDASDRKFYVQAADKGNKQALKDFDAALAAQNKPAPPKPAPAATSVAQKPHVQPERAEDPSDQKFYNMAADRQNKVIDLENRAASLQRDIDALGTAGGYATSAMQAELDEVEAELADLRPPATDGVDAPPPRPLAERQDDIDALASTSPTVAEVMQTELDADVDALEERAHQLRQGIESLGTSGGYAAEAMQAELRDIEVELADFYGEPEQAGDESGGVGSGSGGGGGGSVEEPMPEPKQASAIAVALPVAGGLAVADGPLPVGDAIALGVLGGVGIYAGIKWLGGSDAPNVHMTEAADAADDDVKTSDGITIGDKIDRQSGRRGWDEESIKEVVDEPHATSAATNKANGNDATAYFDEDGSYVVVDDVTGAVIQISDRNDPEGWVPDSTIENPYRPGGN